MRLNCGLKVEGLGVRVGSLAFGRPGLDILKFTARCAKAVRGPKWSQARNFLDQSEA